MVKDELQHSKVFLRAREGDREAFDSLFSEHAAPLRLFVRYRMGRRVRSAMESVDLVQEVYMGAFRAFSTFQGKTQRDFYNWLCGIATHRISDERRKIEAIKRGGAAKFARTKSTSSGSPLDRVEGQGPGPKTLAVLREDGEQMEECFSQLSERDQEVIGLRQFEGLNAKETADRMQINENHVNVLYFRAMQKWRELLEKKAKGN